MKLFSFWLQQLAGSQELPEYDEGALSRARIGDRSYGFVKRNEKFRFKIIRNMVFQEDWMNKSGNLILKIIL
jgi:hypothetical protein